MTRRLLKFFILIFILTLTILIIIKPEICKNSAIRGLLLSGRIIVPSLFPFMSLLLFLMNYLKNVIKKIDFLTKPIFMLSGEMACITIFSFLGGYPIGANLLNKTITDKKSQKRASVMLNFCINAGPAFIISAIGVGLVGSKLLGVILLISHILASIIILLTNRKRLHKYVDIINTNEKSFNIIDSFVNSVASASASTLSICSYVILFSVITAYIEYFSKTFSSIRYLVYIFEVTTAVTKTQNLFLISFLLGFAGISVWCQILSSSKKIKVNIFEFIIFRILHGGISSLITYLIIKFSNINVPTISNNIKFDFSALYSTAPISISLFIMVILLIISLFSKNDTRKIIEDMI